MTKEILIKELIKDGYLKTPILVETFQKIDRKDFVPAELQDEAYGNYPLSIGFGQTISQPLTVAFMLELLGPKPGENILEIGAGSGWQTTILAYVVSRKIEDGRQNKGKVTAMERIRELKEMAVKNAAKYDFTREGYVEIILGDGSKGYPGNAPYDKIIAAAASLDIPPAWRDELKIGGKIVAPVSQSVVVVSKTSANDFKRQEYFGFSFVPLVSDNG